jgi:hypothetical protein
MRPDSLPKMPACVPTAETNSHGRAGRVSSNVRALEAALELACSVPALPLTAAAVKSSPAMTRDIFMLAPAKHARLDFHEA